jgi:hypothetical protein
VGSNRIAVRDERETSADPDQEVSMKRLSYALAGLVAALTVLAVGVVSATAESGPQPMAEGSMSHASHASNGSRMQGLTASDLRALLGRQLGEHAALAMNATNLGVTGSPAFPAAAKALDRNSVALSKSIAAVYGKAAGKAFLDGPFQWRAHIGFFVDYTVATAKKDKAGQSKAVANLKRYTVEHGKLLGGATGLPPKAVTADLLQHVLELKAQLDAYANKQYAQAASIYQDAYAHMFMTADLLAGAIAKQQKLPK